MVNRLEMFKVWTLKASSTTEQDLLLLVIHPELMVHRIHIVLPLGHQKRQMMEPSKKQFAKVFNFLKFKDNKIAETTPFGPMSKYQENPENRIKHVSVREEEDKKQ